MLGKEPCMSGDPYPSISLIQIHVEGVAQLLLKTHKANGSDSLPACFLKD